MNNDTQISPRWAGFRSLWLIIALLLFLFLLISWLLGYGPKGSQCQVKPKLITKTVEVEKIVAAPDTMAPHISLNNLTELHVATGSEFIDKNVTALDNLDGNVTVTVDGKVDVNTPGKYQLIYTATDMAGNSSSETRTVIVEDKIIADTTGPSITLNGQSPVILSAGSAFTDEGAKGVDTVDGEVSVTVTGKVDANTAGKYQLIYTATDKAGNSSSETRTVVVQAKKNIDVEAPMLTLSGASQMTIPLGSSYTEEGFKGNDAVDGEIKVTVTGKVDTSTAGKYPLIYTATDSSGNSISRTRMVTVEAAKPIAMGLPETAKLYFGLGSSKYPQDTQLSLAAVIAYLHKNSDAKAQVTGFHDASGNVSWNKRLSNKRAHTVSRLLQRAGIGTDRIILVNPAQTTGTGLPKEARRVEVSIK